MLFNAPSRCPVCSHDLLISRMTCNHCQTKMEGNFVPGKFSKLPPDQLEFAEIFIKCRGNIKDVERELGISYPTVRNRLEGLIQALGYKTEKYEHDEGEKDRRQDILGALEAGEITAQEATKLLRKTK